MDRILAVEAPFERDTRAQLAAMMPPGVPPIALIRTLVRNLPMARSMGGWGSYELSAGLSLSMRDREIVIDRTCARCGCEYEWGVHIAFFADRVALSGAQIASLTHGDSSDPCWTDERERLLLDAADALHDSSTVDDDLWVKLRAQFDEAELLDLFMLCGWYHAISFTARAAGVPLEDFAPRFGDIVKEPAR